MSKLLYSTLTHDNKYIKQHYIKCVAIYKESKINKNLSWLQAMHIALLAKIDVRHVQRGQLLRFAPVTMKGQ